MVTSSSAMRCVYLVKLKNLKANHNYFYSVLVLKVLCISRKVKKSESKSQLMYSIPFLRAVVYIS